MRWFSWKCGAAGLLVLHGSRLVGMSFVAELPKAIENACRIECPFPRDRETMARVVQARRGDAGQLPDAPLDFGDARCTGDSFDGELKMLKAPGEEGSLRGRREQGRSTPTAVGVGNGPAPEVVAAGAELIGG